MAKPKESKGAPLSVDDYDFGNEFDFEEFDFEPKPVKTKREAVERVAGGVWEGAKGTLKSPSFFRELVKKALPRGYGDMLDIADQSATTVRELYNEGAKEIKPALKDVARVTEKLMPSVAKYTPKAVDTQLKKFIAANKDMQGQVINAQNGTDAAVAGILMDTFKVNATQDARREAKDDVNRGVQAAIDTSRHADSIVQLEGIRTSVVQMAAYQRKIEFGYQKRSLELQARQYYVQVDLMQHTKEYHKRSIEHLAGILNNTSLPDMVKQKTSEKFKDMMRNKFMNNLQDGLFSGRTNFVKNLGTAFREQAIGSVKQFASGVSDGAQGLEMTADMTAQAQEMGMDKFRTAGNLIGGEGARWIGGLAGSKIGKKIMGNGGGEIGKQVRKVGGKLQYGAANAQQIATDWSNSAKGGEEYVNNMLDNRLGEKLPAGVKKALGWLGGALGDPLLDLGRGTVRRANAQDTQVKEAGLDDLKNQSGVTNQANKSLVEVIPGLLARILQSSEGIRTGQDNIDLVQYDWKKGAFSTSQAVRKSIFNDLFDQGSKDGLKNEKNRLLEMVDPNGSLTPAQREELSKRLMSDNLGERAGYNAGKIGNYQDASNFDGSEHGEAFAKLFQKLKEKDKTLGNTTVDNDFSERFSNVGRSAVDRRADIQQILEIFPREVLEDMGLIEEGSSKIDMAKVYKYFGGEEYNPQARTAPSAGRGPRRIRQGGPLPRLGGRNGGPPLPLPSGVGGDVTRLIEVLEQQNTKPLISEIKDILLEMKERSGQPPAPGGPSLSDRLGDVTNAAGDLANSASEAARKAATRLRRRAQVTAGRFEQRNEAQIKAARERMEYETRRAQVLGRRTLRQGRSRMEDVRDRLRGEYDNLDVPGRLNNLRGQAQDLWDNREEHQENARGRINEGWNRIRGAASDAFGRGRVEINNMRQRAADAASRLNQPREGAEGGDDESMLKQIYETLVAIKERLDDGIFTSAYPGPGTPGANLIQRAGGAARRGLGRLNMRISDVVKLGWRTGKGIVKGAASITNSIVGNTVGGVFRAAKGVAGIAGDAAGAVIGGAYRRTRGFVDIYVGNERKPRLYGRILQEGNVYFNRDTNKPIRTIKDITGAVIKRVGGVDEVVLEENEIEHAWQREGPVKKTLKALGAGAKLASRIGKGIFGIVTAGIPPVFKMAMWGAKKAWGLLDMPQDVFVKDKLDDPALTARIMRAGGYVSAASGKTITRPSQIDGPVLSGDEVVLTHDDIRKGLVDKNNKPIKTGLAKLFGFAFGGIKTAAKLAWKAGKLVNKAVVGTAKNGYALGKKLVKGGIAVGGGAFDLLRGRNPFKQRGTAEADQQQLQVTNESNGYLKEIRDLLKERLVKPKKHSAADADDDGVRDGSYEDQMRKKKADLQARILAAKKGSAAAAAAGGKKEGEEDEEGKGGGGLFDSAKDYLMEKAGDKLGRLGKKGRRFVKAKGWKGMAKLGGKALGVAGAAYGAYSAYQNVKEGNYGEAALDGGLAVGSAALSAGGIGALGTSIAGAGAGVVGGLGTAAGVVGSGLAAVGTVLASPVVLGALAVGALGVGAYYGYKYLTKKKLGLLSRIRYVQYGFFPSDEDHVNAVFGLEDKLKDAIIYGKEGPKLDQKRVDPAALIKDFDVDDKDPKQMNAWLTWFGARFKPVFLTHVAGLKGTAPDKWLSDVDGLDADVGLKYLNAVRFPEGPYSQDTSPFKDLKSLPASAGDVKAIIKIADDELTKKAKDPKNAAKAAAAGVAAGSIAALGVAETDHPPPASPISELNGPTSGISQQVLQAATTAAIAVPPMKGGQVMAAGSSAVLESLGVDRLDGIDVVRLKAYGLVKMEQDKVKSLMALEKYINDKLSFSKNVATWGGSLEQTLSDNGPAFGVDVTNESLAANWLNWFQQRFLPVYLNYATLIKGQTGKETPVDGKTLLKPQQIVEVATGIFTTSGPGGSIWNVSTSPWDGYAMNSDVRSTDGNMQGMKDMAKNAILPEPGKSANQPSANKSSANTASATPATKPTTALGGLWDKAKSLFSSSASSGPQIGGGAGTSGGINQGQVYGGAGGSVGQGVEISQPGKGTGGDINSIPKPTGNKSWAALKDTILGASQMVGVDSKLMSVMAAIESGFDYTVKAGTSSASGLYQFINDTWKWMLKKYGAKYGIDPNTPQTDPRANALMGAEYIKDNMAALEGKIGRQLTDTDVYFAHFLGSGGAKKFLSADPNAIASTILPDAARANKGIFYSKQGVPLTVGQVYELVNSRVRNKAKAFGINDGGEQMTKAPPPPPPVTKDGAAVATPPPSAAGGGQASSDIKGPDPEKTKPADAAKGGSAYGVGSKVTPPPGTTATPSTASAPPAPSSSGPTANGVPIGGLQGGGFSAPRPIADTVSAAVKSGDVRISNVKDFADAFGPTNGILTEIRDLMQGMVNSAQTKGGDPKESTQTSQQARQQQRQVKDLPRAPISVARPAAPY